MENFTIESSKRDQIVSIIHQSHPKAAENAIDGILYGDWPNADEHQEWLTSATAQEIADWAEGIYANMVEPTEDGDEVEDETVTVAINGGGRSPGDVSIGDYAYDSTSGTMYKITGETSSIMTDRVNNYVTAEAVAVGDAFSVTEDEFDAAWSCTVEDDTDAE